ncbi:unnamed protein product [Haemonchus placei]|uniref:DUF4440 domain-containing protein n=1 Tax=Haemonchus placei TaxID=6290 RepID=A0A0N4VSV9_HAEPC|nr:unnamed protein product [Haemonchus placei]
MTRLFFWIVSYDNISSIFVQASEAYRIATIYKLGDPHEETVIFEMLILTFLACIVANVAAEDIEATLKPYYEKLEKAVENQNIKNAVRLYHGQAVIVKKDMYVVYGKKEITKDYEDVWKKLGPHTFVLSNQTYEGTDDYKIAEFNFEILRKPDRTKIVEGRMLHIWKRRGEKFYIYHEQFELKQ